jgi:serine/threonine protein kinase
MSVVTKAIRLSSIARDIAPRNGGVHRLRIPYGKGELALTVRISATGDIDLGGEVVSVEPFVLAAGGRVGKYLLEEKVGQGTCGVVFTANDPELDRRVAIKFLNPASQLNEEVLRRFLQEARASARIAHPGIVTVLDSGKVATATGEIAFIVFELLGGESLAKRLARSGKLAPVTAVEIARQIASALDAAHRAGVLHRDLKSENVQLVPDPAVHSGERVKVLDFGLAKLGRGQHTNMGTVFGTPRYMSPEHCRSAASVDHRSDIYSLGCILFELITGRTPFVGELRQQVEGHIRIIAPRASLFAPDITPALDELIAQMLAKDPNGRPPTMADVETALRAHGGGSPYVAATILPTAAKVIALWPPAPVVATPAYPPPYYPPAFPKPARAKTSSCRGSFATSALVFFIFAMLTAVAARGHLRRTASASPSLDKSMPSVTSHRTFGVVLHEH